MHRKRRPVPCVYAYRAKLGNTAHLLPIKQTSCTIQLPCDWCSHLPSWWYVLRASVSMRRLPQSDCIYPSRKQALAVLPVDTHAVPRSPCALDGCSVPSGPCGFPIQTSIHPFIHAICISIQACLTTNHHHTPMGIYWDVHYWLSEPANQICLRQKRHDSYVIITMVHGEKCNMWSISHWSSHRKPSCSNGRNWYEVMRIVIQRN